MNILIVEDEIPTRRHLEKTIKELRPHWSVAGVTGSVEETVEWLEKNPLPELIFMDIQLSDGISFEVFDQVEVKSMVIFTTAYDEYAIQAFNVNSIDYLLKPILPQKLEEAISKFERLYTPALHQHFSRIDFNQLAQALKLGLTNYRTRFMVNLIDGFHTLPVNDIAWIESANKITTAVTFNGHHHILDFTLDKLEKELDPALFFRANRQYILNVNTIRKVENWFNGKLVVKTRPDVKEKLVVSRERSRSFKEWVDR